MFDGALSWLALVAARYLCEGQVPERGTLELAGALDLLPALRLQGRLGHARRARAEVLAGLVRRASGARTSWRSSSRRPGSDAHAEVERIFLERTREEWREFASSHDCCLEPVLDLDEALDSELVRAREMVVEVDQPGADERCACSACRSSSRAPRARRPARARRSASTPHEVLAALGYEDGEIAALEEAGAVAGPADAGARGSFMG